MAKLRARDRQLKALAVAIQAQEPTIVIGPPGVGKTACIIAICSSLGKHNETVLASLREPSDFCGLPVPENTEGKLRVHMVAPAWAHKSVEEKGNVFLDEATCTSPRTQAALLRVVHERVCGELAMNDVSFILAGNPADQAAGGYDITGPLANRMIWMTWELDPESWTDGMINGWSMPALPTLPEDWKDKIPKHRAYVAGFIRTFPQKLLMMPEEESKRSGPWASPRTWEQAARLMAACDAAGVNGEVEAELLGGCIGHGTALEYITWLRDMDMPNPEALLKDPESFKLPPRQDKAYTVLASVAAAVIGRLTVDRWKAGWKVLAVAAKQGTIDTAAVAARLLVSNRPKGASAPDEARIFVPLLQAAGLLGDGSK